MGTSKTRETLQCFGGAAEGVGGGSAHIVWAAKSMAAPGAK